MTHASGVTATILLLGLCHLAAPASAQSITAETLQGATVVATVNYDIVQRRGGDELSMPGSVTYQLSFGENGAFTGSVTRTTTTRRGPTTRVQKFSGIIGQPRESRGAIRGHVVWVLSGNTLRMLRTYEVGGKTATITFGSGTRTCVIRSPFMREQGAGGAVRREAIAGGGMVAIISARQTSSSCEVTRG